MDVNFTSRQRFGDQERRKRGMVSRRGRACSRDTAATSSAPASGGRSPRTLLLITASPPTARHLRRRTHCSAPDAALNHNPAPLCAGMRCLLRALVRVALPRPAHFRLTRKPTGSRAAHPSRACLILAWHRTQRRLMDYEQD